MYINIICFVVVIIKVIKERNARISKNTNKRATLLVTEVAISCNNNNNNTVNNKYTYILYSYTAN